MKKDKKEKELKDGDIFVKDGHVYQAIAMVDISSGKEHIIAVECGEIK